MLDPDLKAACTSVYDWCAQQGIDYDIVCDEDDIQGILIFKRHRGALPGLLEHLLPRLDGLHLEQVQVRAGTILLLSLQALNESEIGEAIGDATVKTEFQYKIHDIFQGKARPVAETASPQIPLKQSLMNSARAMRESQYKQPTQTFRRSGSTNIFKRAITRGHGDGEALPAGSTEGEPDGIQHKQHMPKPGKSPATGPKLPPPGGDKVAARPKGKLISREGYSRREIFQNTLSSVLAELAPTPGAAPAPTPGGAEGLQGLGAEHQPGDLFQRFAQAMQALGTAMHLGAPLQDLLKKQGIQWKKSEDGQAIIFFVQNAQTNAPQPIARIGYQTLGKPQEFQVQLANMMDFAKGQAPGTEQQKYEEAQEAQKQMRELANQFAPPQQGQGAPGAAQPTTMAPPQPAAPAKPAAPAGPAKPAAKPAPAIGAKPAPKPVAAKPAPKPMAGKPAPGPGPAKPV